MFAQVFARTMQAGFHGRNTGGQNFGDLGMAAAFLDEGEQRTILGAQLGERMAQGVEFLGAHGAGGLGDVFVFLPERDKDPPEFLAPQLIDAGVAREPEQPRLELRRRLQTIEGADHLDEHLLGEILHVVAASGHGVNEAGDPMLIADNELMLGGFVAPLSQADKVSQRIR